MKRPSLLLLAAVALLLCTGARASTYVFNEGDAGCTPPVRRASVSITLVEEDAAHLNVSYALAVFEKSIDLAGLQAVAWDSVLTASPSIDAFVDEVCADWIGGLASPYRPGFELESTYVDMEGATTTANMTVRVSLPPTSCWGAPRSPRICTVASCVRTPRRRYCCCCCL